MKFSHPRTAGTISYVIIALCCHAAFTAHALTQSHTRPSPVERRNDHMSRQREQHERETLRGPDGKPQKPTDRKPSQSVIAEVKHDFERIQIAYNEIVVAMSHDRSPEHRLILDATAEIKKCADRLKKNLALPSPENKVGEKEKVALKQEEIKPSLQRLCLHIANFVTNPVFDNMAVVDVEQSGKASKDLEEIIRLSDMVWRSANEMGEAKK
ncbi:MAG TPA: hypothetical protein VF131_14255 [Blastocatellia bacterium]|nr:hypothetical protein [Blastocatellia bacterium]